MEITNKSLQELLLFSFEKKDSLQQFLPLLKKISNFSLFQMNDNADSLYHFSIRKKNPFFFMKIYFIVKVYSRRDLVEYFIRLDYKVSIPNKSLEIPLHLACEKGEFEIANILIKRSKNLNIQDNSGNTPLHKALICPIKNRLIIMNLIKNGCELNKMNENNETPLIYGLSQGNPGRESIDVFFEEFKDFFNFFSQGFFLIFFLAENVEFLLEFNVDLSVKDSQKKDAVFLACSKKEARILEILLKKMPDFQPKNYMNLLAFAIQKSKKIE